MANRNQWNVTVKMASKVYDYWWLDDAGRVYNAVAIGEQLAKPATFEPKMIAYLYLLAQWEVYLMTVQ